MGRPRSNDVLESCAGSIDKCTVGGLAVTCPQCVQTSSTRECPNCRKLRPDDCFLPGCTRCSVCLAYSRGQHIKHRTERNRKDVARLYGMSVADYDAVLEAYDNRCAICGRTSGQVSKRDGRSFALHVDHDHATGKFRGLLCYRCNQILGWIEQSEWVTVLRAKDYVEGKVGPIWSDARPNFPARDLAEAVS